jgi:hypothetical protein
MVDGRSLVGMVPSVRGGDARWVGGGGSVALDRRAHRVDVADPGLGEAGQVVASTIDFDLEVPGPPIDAQGELRRDAPAEVLESVAVGVPGREDRGAEPLDVAVFIACGRSDVVGGDDPA